jgi:hypothetical protein
MILNQEQENKKEGAYEVYSIPCSSAPRPLFDIPVIFAP